MAQVEKVEARGRKCRNEMVALAGLSFLVAGLMLLDWVMRDYSIAGEIVAGLGGYSGFSELILPAEAV